MATRLTREQIEERLRRAFTPEQSAVLTEAFYEIRRAVLGMPITLTRQQMEENFAQHFTLEQADVLVDVLDEMRRRALERG